MSHMNGSLQMYFRKKILIPAAVTDTEFKVNLIKLIGKLIKNCGEKKNSRERKRSKARRRKVKWHRVGKSYEY